MDKEGFVEDVVTGGKLKPSHKAIWAVVALLILAKLVESLVHVPFTNPSQQAIFSWKSLAFFVSLLLLGSGFAHIIGFPGMWDEKVTNRQRIWAPLGIGLVIGVALLAVPVLLSVASLEMMGSLAPGLVGLRGDRAALSRLESLSALASPVREPELPDEVPEGDPHLRATALWHHYDET